MPSDSRRPPADPLRPGGIPLSTTLESEQRLRNLQPQRVVEYLCAPFSKGADAPPPTILDVGAGSGLFSLAFARARPEATVVALDVRADAVRAVRRRATNEKLSNLSALLMDARGVPALPAGTPPGTSLALPLSPYTHIYVHMRISPTYIYAYITGTCFCGCSRVGTPL